MNGSTEEVSQFYQEFAFVCFHTHCLVRIVTSKQKGLNASCYK